MPLTARPPFHAPAGQLPSLTTRSPLGEAGGVHTISRTTHRRQVSSLMGRYVVRRGQEERFDRRIALGHRCPGDCRHG